MKPTPTNTRTCRVRRDRGVSVFCWSSAPPSSSRRPSSLRPSSFYCCCWFCALIFETSASYAFWPGRGEPALRRSPRSSCDRRPPVSCPARPGACAAIRPGNRARLAGLPAPSRPCRRASCLPRPLLRQLLFLLLSRLRCLRALLELLFLRHHFLERLLLALFVGLARTLGRGLVHLRRAAGFAAAVSLRSGLRGCAAGVDSTRLRFHNRFGGPASAARRVRDATRAAPTAARRAVTPAAALARRLRRGLPGRARIPGRRRRQRLGGRRHEGLDQVRQLRRDARRSATQDLRRDHDDQLGLFLLRRLALEQEAEDRDVADAGNLLHLRRHRCCSSGRRSRTSGRPAVPLPSRCGASRWPARGSPERVEGVGEVERAHFRARPSP